MFNKVIYKGTEILNISNDTVVAEALHAGYTAHDGNGVPITGTAKTYEQGFVDGQASVRHIYFYVSYEQYCTVSGTTWREFVETDVSGNFSITNNQVYVYGSLLGSIADDEIMENGYYDPLYIFYLTYNSKRYELFKEEYMEWSNFVSRSDLNTIGLYFDEEDYLRTPTGEYIYVANYDGVINTEYGGMINIYGHIETDEYIGERKADVFCNIDGWQSVICPSGMTWQEIVNSLFRPSEVCIYEYEGEEYIYQDGTENILYLDGVRVKPSDVIVNGATYEYVEE